MFYFYNVVMDCPDKKVTLSHTCEAKEWGHNR